MSMEDAVERIGSPISQTSSAGKMQAGAGADVRPGSALSAISSGDDLPSSAGTPGTPGTSDEFMTAVGYFSLFFFNKLDSNCDVLN